MKTTKVVNKQPATPIGGIEMDGMERKTIYVMEAKA